MRAVLLVAAFASSSMIFACGAGPTTPITPVDGANGDPAPVPLASPPESSTASTAPAALPLGATHHDAADLDPARATEKAPDVFRARFTTTRGEFVVEAHRSWAPNGADRFYNLVKMGFFDDTRFFRAIDGFMVQFGIPGEPQVSAKWRDANIKDDKVTQSNLRGFVTFAQTGQPDSRSTQIFVLYANHPRLDQTGFAPFGRVVQGMEVLDALYKGYGEGAPNGKGPDQMRIQQEGNAYLDKEFPKLDRILRTSVEAQ